ncbi:MAG: DUF3413 domain-containing protein [Deltaproteobacteria bacterium]|nr:DUF3413 domain-containing protein [Deltaproteobacteria bacterium]
MANLLNLLRQGGRQAAGPLLTPPPSNRGEVLGWLGWLLLANALLLTAMATRYGAHGLWPSQWAGVVFLLLAMPGQMVVISLLPWLLAALAGLVWPRAARLAGTLGFTVLVLVVLGDTQVYQLFRFHMNALVWNLILGGAASEIFEFSWMEWLEAILILLLVVWLEWRLGGWVWGLLQRGWLKRGWAVAAGIFLWIMAGQVLHGWADANRYTPITRQAALIPWGQFLRADDFFRQHGWAPAEGTRIGPPDAENGVNYPLEPLACKASAKPYNLLLIVLDSWRGDALTPQITPNLWRYAQTSQVFDHHYAAGIETRYGIFGLFYGLYGSYFNPMLTQRKGALLVNELSRQGYHLEVQASAALTSPEFDRTVFADVAERITLRQKEGSADQRDRDITNHMLAMLDQAGTKPFFGFLFYDAPHAYAYPKSMREPFQPSWKEIRYLELNPDFDPTPFFNRYKNAVYYADVLAGQVLAKLKARGLDKNTVVVITGDHGQEFNDSKKNYWGHAANFMDYTARVPLIVRWPGRPPAAYHHMTSQLDVAPTLMRDLLGCSTPYNRYSLGTHLLTPGGRPFVVVSGGIRFGLREPDRITVVSDSGLVEVLDPNDNPLPQPPNQQHLLQVMDGMSRFLKAPH